MTRAQIDKALKKTVQELLDKGADRSTLELACAGLMCELKADGFRAQPKFKG